jgi:hypothetical protein
LCVCKEASLLTHTYSRLASLHGSCDAHYNCQWEYVMMKVHDEDGGNLLCTGPVAVDVCLVLVVSDASRTSSTRKWDTLKHVALREQVLSACYVVWRENLCRPLATPYLYHQRRCVAASGRGKGNNADLMLMLKKRTARCRGDRTPRLAE